MTRTRSIIAILAAGALLSLGACKTLTGTSQTPHQAAGKALTDVALTLKAAADEADTAAKAGLIHGQTAATVSADLKLAQQSMNAANQAYQAMQDNTVQADVAAVTTLAADIVIIVVKAQGGQ